MKLLFVILFITSLASCNTNSNTYIQPGTLKVPDDSLTFYFPVNTFSDIPRADSFTQNWYSSTLYSFKEPVLSQSYVGHNMYRFLWLRSFHQPVVFTLHQSDGNTWLNTKMLDEGPHFYDERIGGISKENRQKYIDQGFAIDKDHPDIMVRIADRKANIIFNRTISLSNTQWNKFEQLLEKANFWKLPTNIDDGSTDGAFWVIEGHLKNKYHIVDYHSPGNDPFANAGLFLIKLSGLKEEIY